MKKKDIIINETTTTLVKLIDLIYKSDDGMCGGYAHIVVDDENLDDDCIQFCIEACENPVYGYSNETKIACLNCLLYMQSCTMEERESAMYLYNNRTN
jgi:hypothetical protein